MLKKPLYRIKRLQPNLKSKRGYVEQINYETKELEEIKYF